MLVPEMPARRADRLDLLIGKLGGGEAAAAFPQTPELVFLFLGPREVGSAAPAEITETPIPDDHIARTGRPLPASGLR